MVHCITHGLEDCLVCQNVRAKLERELEIQRRLEEREKRRHRTSNPYLHFGEE